MGKAVQRDVHAGHSTEGSGQFEFEAEDPHELAEAA